MYDEFILIFIGLTKEGKVSTKGSKGYRGIISFTAAFFISEPLGVKFPLRSCAEIHDSLCLKDKQFLHPPNLSQL